MLFLRNMIKNEYKVVGVMSGTSLDGIDLAYITFTHDENWNFKIERSETISYDENWLIILKNIVTKSLNELQDIDASFTLFLSKTIKNFMKRNNIEQIDAICSHGHTALHQPKNGLTYQIGNKEELATELNETIVCDFRVQDVQLGGQGAPLVPIGDQILFSQYEFCINLGGFANISTTKNNSRIAHDICPVNIVLNHYSELLGFDYDSEGKLASQGTINKQLLLKLNNLEFYNKPYPKSLGLEWVNKKIFPLIDKFGLKPKDVLRTFVEHIAHQISKQLKSSNKSTILVTGGGSYNSFLIKRLKSITKFKVTLPSKEIIDYKEALIFGLLGVLKLRGEINCLSSVTGAKYDHSTGVIFHP